MRQTLPLLLPVLMTAIFSASAQSDAVKFQHFHNSGAGQYRQETQAFRDGKPMGQPFTDTHCAAPLSAANAAAAQRMGNMGATINTCTSRVLIDTPADAVSEQTCNPGAMQTVIRMEMHAVNDRVTTDVTRMSIGGHPQSETRSTVTYLGACTAAQNAENARIAATPIPTMPKPSKADCAEIAQMKQQASEANPAACKDMPADYRARCEAAMQIAQNHVKQMEAMCK